jgi:heat shock protein 4
MLPSTKILTFYRKQPFTLEARYAKPEELPGKIPAFIGQFFVKGVKATGSPDDFMICKLKARVNIHGVLNVESGYYVEDQEIEEEIKEDEKKEEGEKKDGDVSTFMPVLQKSRTDSSFGGDSLAGSTSGSDNELPPKRRKVEDNASADGGNPVLTSNLPKAMDTDAPKDDKPKTRKVKKQVRKGELPIVSATSSLDPTLKSAASEKESAMVMEDKLVADTEEKKNELETYIYELRNKLDDQYAPFASDEEKEKIRTKLEAAEVSLRRTISEQTCIC